MDEIRPTTFEISAVVPKIDDLPGTSAFLTALRDQMLDGDEQARRDGHVQGFRALPMPFFIVDRLATNVAAAVERQAHLAARQIEVETTLAHVTRRLRIANRLYLVAIVVTGTLLAVSITRLVITLSQ